ncbi:PHA/PHB synthase family protein [Roseovarius confluentis]|uniref:PHA/PHB synthase family protein n=1 Tax=Roseovarius confluentis TaxID=1852027 RepID=UPI003BAAAE6D
MKPEQLPQLHRGAHDVTPVDALDRAMSVSIGRLTMGVSPIALWLAWFDWVAHLAASPGRQVELWGKGLRKALRLQSFLMNCVRSEETEGCIDPLPQDRRFVGEAWKQWPFNLWSQSFLLSQQWWHAATTGPLGVTPENERQVQFFGRQILDMMAPTNFAWTNPEVLERTWAEGGANLLRGATYLADDLLRSATDAPPAGTEAFRPGHEVAITEGDVVYRNHLIELIRYRPSTGEVRPEPVLVVPAWIMKYYILDLSPKNSLIRWLVAQGFSVFVISWRNPTERDRDLALDDYRTQGVMAAMDVVARWSGQKVHATGYCLGGTLLAIAAAAMARDGDDRLATLSFFAAQTDFTEAGEIQLYLSEAQVAFLEEIMAERGVLEARQMAGAFRMLRSNDLLWSRMVTHYLLGQPDPVTDLMAWNADATRLPARMHSEYLRKLYLNNDLSEGRLKVEGHPVVLSDIRVPICLVGTERDHVAPWRSVYKATLAADSETTFILTNGGHNAGIISEPNHPNRHYRCATRPSMARWRDPERWFEETPVEDGSWWPAWARWLAARSGAPVAVSAASRDLPVLAPAPGRYVLER